MSWLPYRRPLVNTFVPIAFPDLVPRRWYRFNISSVSSNKLSGSGPVPMTGSVIYLYKTGSRVSVVKSIERSQDLGNQNMVCTGVRKFLVVLE